MALARGVGVLHQGWDLPCLATKRNRFFGALGDPPLVSTLALVHSCAQPNHSMKVSSLPHQNHW